VTGPVDPQILRRELLHVIGEAIENHPRSQQVTIGPSEIGTPCERRIGYKLLNHPAANHQPPGWRPTVGTAVHSWLEDVFDAWNINAGLIETPRWLVETRQSVGQILGEDLEGTCDLFDTTTGTSIDWKIPGPTTMRKAKAAVARGEIHDPQYRVQAHLYGRGWQMRGHQVHTVAVCFLPAAGELSDAVFWSEPYDEQIAIDALERASRIHTIVTGFGQRALPILPTADAHCGHCDWFKPGATDPTVACPGAEALEGKRPRSDSVTDLIA
jgi:hypothetical protein